MKAARSHRLGGPEIIMFEDLPLPEPGPGELRIRVQAASFNPVDYMARPNGSQLLDIGQLVEEGRVRPHVARVMPLDAVADAHRVLEHDHIRGKLVWR